jgi:hypothetical protein
VARSCEHSNERSGSSVSLSRRTVSTLCNCYHFVLQASCRAPPAPARMAVRVCRHHAGSPTASEYWQFTYVYIQYFVSGCLESLVHIEPTVVTEE